MHYGRQLNVIENHITNFLGLLGFHDLGTGNWLAFRDILEVFCDESFGIIDVDITAIESVALFGT